jgi:hypothetical protein
MVVKQLMNDDVKVCLESDTLNRAAELMWNQTAGFFQFYGTRRTAC